MNGALRSIEVHDDASREALDRAWMARALELAARGCIRPRRIRGSAA